MNNTTKLTAKAEATKTVTITLYKKDYTFNVDKELTANIKKTQDVVTAAAEKVNPIDSMTNDPERDKIFPDAKAALNPEREKEAGVKVNQKNLVKYGQKRLASR